ncbi:MAG: glycerophosphodiester phosphodiesterase family protein [Prevotella sp.]|jgi:glycerophosphoryl diester phosphodiesterase|nr:glycerophosphodiester phosphodiesterase family protein [Prevotella sp.]
MGKDMKKTITIFCFLFLTVTYAFSQTRVDSLLQKLHNPAIDYVFVASHRGDWRNAPENSLPAIENVIKMGVDIVELDVQRTRDGQFILMHDATLDRTTTGKGKISDWTLDSIRALRLKNGCAIKTKEKVPALEEALILMKGRILVNLDKADRYFDEIFPLLEKTGTTGQVIMKGSKPAEEVRVQFGHYLDKVIYMPVVNMDKESAETQIQSFLTELKPVAFELLFINDSNLLPKQIKPALAGKSLIWYNTLWDTMAGGHDDDMSLENPDAGYGYLIDTLGAKMLQTDRPAYLLEYLKKRGLRK